MPSPDPPLLWVLPPLEPAAPWLVRLSWLGVFAFSALSWAGIVWAIGVCL